MVWKRLNDHGKNWRHVYKSLVLLEYLIKTGSEKVTLKINLPSPLSIFAIKDYSLEHYLALFLFETHSKLF